MKKLHLQGFLLAGAIAACSGYSGGGDVRISPVADSGVTPTVDGGTPGPGPGPSPRDGGFGPGVPPASSVVAYYPLDGDGSDMSPRAAGLNLQVLLDAEFDSGRVGQALLLLGSGFSARRPQVDDAFAFGSGDFTMQAWIAAGEVPTGIGTRPLQSPAGEGWALYATSSVVAFETNSGPLATSVPPTSAYRHVVIRRASGMLHLYVDGAHLMQRAEPSPFSAGQFGIQRASTPSTTPGRVDEVVIWSRALDGDEIQTQRSRGLNGQPAILTE